MIPYAEIDVSAPLASAFRERGLTVAATLITVGILTGLTSSLLIGNLSQARILMAMARDGMLPEGFFAAVHPRFKTPWKSTILVGVVVALGGALAPLGFLADLVSDRYPVRLRGRLRGGLDPPADEPRDRAAVPRPRRLLRGAGEHRGQRRPDVLARPRQLASALRLAHRGTGDLLHLQPLSRQAQARRRRRSRQGSSTHMNDDFSKYEMMRDAGSSPEDVYREAVKNGVDPITRIRLIRAVYSLSPGRRKRSGL